MVSASRLAMRVKTWGAPVLAGVIGAMCCAWIATSATAQGLLPPAGVVRGERAQDSTTPAHVPWYAPIASLAVPGLGQAVLRNDRALAYLAVEVYSLLEYRSHRAEGRRGQSRYREIAHDVARALFGGDRPAGPFEYYESMRKFVESGAFDRIPGGDVDPEIDENTFNGTIWRLARDTYWSDPDIPPPPTSEAYEKAIALYFRRAVLPEYRWSWRNAALEHDLYRKTIERSNTAFRRAREHLGVLIANHLLSMADAFATVRLRYPDAGPARSVGVEVRVRWP
jgi:hypothetical protein